MRSLHRLRLLALGLLALSLTSCVDNGASVVVLGPVTPTLEEGSCLLEVKDEYIVFGRYAPAYQNGYVMGLRFENQVRARGSDTRANPNFVLITGADISLRFIDGSLVGLLSEGGLPLPNPYFVTATGRASAATSADSTSSGLATFNAVPEDYRFGLNTLVEGTGGLEIIVSIQLHYQTAGGIEEIGAPFDWPLSLELLGEMHRCVGSDDDTGGACFLGNDFTAALPPGFALPNGTVLCP